MAHCIYETKDGLYVTQVRPQSQLAEQLVEKYNLSYTFADASQYNGLIIGGLIIASFLTLMILHKKGKLGVGVSSMKNGASKATPLPEITLERHWRTSGRNEGRDSPDAVDH